MQTVSYSGNVNEIVLFFFFNFEDLTRADQILTLLFSILFLSLFTRFDFKTFSQAFKSSSRTCNIFGEVVGIRSRMNRQFIFAVFCGSREALGENQVYFSLRARESHFRLPEKRYSKNKLRVRQASIGSNASRT